MTFSMFVESILSGVSKGKSVEDIAKKHHTDISYIKKQIKRGTKEEKEHTKKSSVAKKIAKDHLFKIPDYYTKLAKMEKTK